MPTITILDGHKMWQIQECKSTDQTFKLLLNGSTQDIGSLGEMMTRLGGMLSDQAEIETLPSRRPIPSSFFADL